LKNALGWLTGTERKQAFLDHSTDISEKRIELVYVKIVKPV